MGLFDIFKSKKKAEKTEATALTAENNEKNAKSNGGELSVFLEQLPATYGLDETALVEIKDTHILERIGSLTPSATCAGSSIGNMVKNLSPKDETLYRVVLKKGGTLVNSKSTPGAKRAITMGKNGIQEHAELFAVNPKTNKTLTIANTSAAVMSLASVVVGQYYMQQVDNQLNAINNSISKIADFLDIQYKQAEVNRQIVNLLRLWLIN